MRFLLLSMLASSFMNTSLLAATSTARIHQKIHPALSIEKLSDMFFPDAFPGAPAYRIDHDQTETLYNASFLVSGEPGKRVNIILPTQKIALENGRTRDKIYVSRFSSNVGSSTSLGKTGELTLFVGATREEIPARLPSGDYSGNFSITVIY